MKRSFCLSLLLAGLLPVLASADPIPLHARRIPLNPEDPGQLSVGRLLWRGSLEISSSDPRFGGLSGLLLENDGRSLLSVSDKGYWLTAALEHDAAGMLIGLGNAQMGALLDEQGQPLKSKSLGDAEALTRLPDGSLLVAFEQKHRIWRFGPATAPLAMAATAFPTPPGLRRLRDNNGLEALAVVADAQVLALAEDPGTGPTSPGYFFSRGNWSDIALVRVGIYRPTGATAIPSGDILLLERRFSFLGGLGFKIRRLPQTALYPDATLRGDELAQFHPPLNYDNMEGIAAGIGPDGDTVIYLISDDNFSPFHRTILMSFSLSGG